MALPAAAAVMIAVCPVFFAKRGGGLLFYNKNYLVFSLLFLAGGLRFIQADTAYLQAAAVMEEKPYAQVTGVICGRQDAEGSVRYELKNARIFVSGKCVRAPGFYVYSARDDMTCGSEILAKGYLNPFSRARNEGNFDGVSYYRSLGIYGRMFDAQVTVTEKPDFCLRERLYVFRERIRDTYEDILNERDAGILSSMCLGDRTLLPDETKELYQMAGIMHLLAISGMHISILGMSLYRLLRKGMGFVPSAALAGIPIVLFALMSGAGSSTLRAAIMFGVYLLAQVLGRTYDLLSALGLACLLLLSKNPLLVENAGFQFSFLAVSGVGVAYPAMYQGFCKTRDTESEKDKNTGENKKKNKGFAGKLRRSVIFMTTIQITLLPLTLYYYYQIPVYSVPVNLLVVPFAGALLGMGLAGGVSGIFFRKPALIFLCPAHILLEIYDRICAFFTKLPGALWTPGQPKPWMMLLYYGILAVLLFLFSRDKGNAVSMPEKAPGGRAPAAGKLAEKAVCRGRRALRGRILVYGAALAGNCLIFGLRTSVFEIDILDVGQGDGIYISSDDGTDFFIDGGSSDVSDVGKYRILPFLKAKGVSAVDYWFVSHGDSDHISGLLWMLESGYSVGHLVFSEAMPQDDAWESLTEAAAQNETEVICLGDGDILSDGALSFRCIGAYDGADRNDASLILLLEYGEFQGLFAGDISESVERILINEGRLEEVDVYKANHHGSKYSSSEAFLEVVNPLLTVISCGENNSYGHPHEETLQRLEAVRSITAVTADCGRIKILWKDESLIFNAYTGQSAFR